jgi:hypothetical protein
MTKRILVVEDQPDSRRIIRDMLALLIMRSPKRKMARKRWRLSQNNGLISS